MESELQKLNTKLKKTEKELDNCRTSSYVDGWQTQKHAKKARKWDILAQEKINLIQKIDDIKSRDNA